VQKQLAFGLCLASYRSLYQMSDRNPPEFEGKVGVIAVNSPQGKQLVRVISYHGVSRVTMDSDAPARGRSLAMSTCPVIALAELAESVSRVGT
jgi:hypothetical protein